ncbi:MAG: ubiquinone/menaquinone biosynthesis methyltransferase [Deltaproteobacteria bacterium]|nr:ubiquinone/menaquinone biosynthesis methyltransferase [Nannocystaceae bacterium]
MNPGNDSVALVDEHGAKVQRMFGRIAHGYDRANRVMSLGIDERWRSRAVDDLLAHLPTDVGATALDLCAGTLDSTVAIAKRWPGAKVIAGDFSAEMLEKGDAKIQGELSGRVRSEVMDAHALPLEDESVDAIFCAFGIRNVSDLDRATAEQARILHDGGKLCVLEFFRPTGLFTRVMHRIYNQTLLPLVGWALTGDREAYQYLPRSIGKFDSTEEFTARLRSHGFTDVRVEPLTLGMAWIIRATRGPRGGAHA